MGMKIIRVDLTPIFCSALSIALIAVISGGVTWSPYQRQSRLAAITDRELIHQETSHHKQRVNVDKAHNTPPSYFASDNGFRSN